MSDETQSLFINAQTDASSANQAFDALINLLDEEARQYEVMVTKLREKQDILIAGKPKLLGKIDQELMIISRKTTLLEEKRLTLMAELGQPQQTLSQLIAKMEEPKAASALRTCRDRLVRAAKDAQQQNQDTQDLLSLSLQWIQDTVELIASVLNPEAASYTVQGNKVGQKNSAPPQQSTINHSA